MTIPMILTCVGLTLAVFVFGLFVGSWLTYSRERGHNPVPFAGIGRAALKRVSGFRKPEKGDDSVRWSA